MASVGVAFMLLAIVVFGLIARFGDLPKLLGARSDQRRRPEQHRPDQQRPRPPRRAMKGSLSADLPRAVLDPGPSLRWVVNGPEIRV
jgi:hypothetical protein